VGSVPAVVGATVAVVTGADEVLGVVDAVVVVMVSWVHPAVANSVSSARDDIAVFTVLFTLSV
jgi:hypothetical protein